MAGLVIKNLPDELHRQLKARAAEHRRSMTQEVLQLLERGLAGDETVVAEPPAPYKGSRDGIDMAGVITSIGQVTIPKPVRDRLKLHAGDRLDFIVESDGTVRLIPVTGSIKELKGLVPRPKRKLSLEDMDDAIAKGASKT